MKKLKLAKLNLKNYDVLKEEQLKVVFGGGYGGCVLRCLDSGGNEIGSVGVDRCPTSLPEAQQKCYNAGGTGIAAYSCTGPACH